MIRCLLSGALRLYSFQCSVIAIFIQAYVFVIASIAQEVLHLLNVNVNVGSLCLLQVKEATCPARQYCTPSNDCNAHTAVRLTINS
jgi:hypothetical protein